MLYLGSLHGLVYVTLTTVSFEIVPSKDIGRVLCCRLVDVWPDATLSVTATVVAPVIAARGRVLGRQRRRILGSVGGYRTR